MVYVAVVVAVMEQLEMLPVIDNVRTYAFMCSSAHVCYLVCCYSACVLSSLLLLHNRDMQVR